MKLGAAPAGLKLRRMIFSVAIRRFVQRELRLVAGSKPDGTTIGVPPVHGRLTLTMQGFGQHEPITAARFSQLLLAKTRPTVACPEARWAIRRQRRRALYIDPYDPRRSKVCQLWSARPVRIEAKYCSDVPITVKHVLELGKY